MEAESFRWIRLLTVPGKENTWMDVESTLKDFIKENFLACKGQTEISNEDMLLDTGLVDSVGVFELISFIGRTFGIELDDTEIVPENFESINRLAAFIRSKQRK
jgi:acyl carrier protein